MNRPPASTPLSPGRLDARYSINSRALQRWAKERVRFIPRADRTVEARFRFDGTTCANLGQPLAFEYRVHLDAPETGYVIREATCGPAPDDLGHPKMCAYLANGAALLETIAQERPLLNQPLADILTWLRSSAPAGCYCDAESRAHKWGLVLETIHYALTHQPSLATSSPSPAS